MVLELAKQKCPPTGTGGTEHPAKLNRLKNRAHIAWQEFRLCRYITDSCCRSRPLTAASSPPSSISTLSEPA